MIEASNGLHGERKTAVTFDGQTVRIERGQRASQRTATSIPASRITMIGFKVSLSGPRYIEFVSAGVDGRVEFPYWKRGEFQALREAVTAALGQH